MKKVSIIVPVYNTEKYLGKCLESLSRQSLEDIEIICVDDGSSDNSGQICDRFASLDKRFTVIHKENEGVSKARNTALDIADGVYVGFVDSDDWVECNMFEKLYEKAVSNSYDIVQCAYNGGRKCEKELTLTGEEEIIPSFMEGAVSNSVWDKIYKAELIRDIRFEIDLRFAEDFEFNARALLSARVVSIIPDVLYHYTERAGSETHFSINNAHIDGFRVYDYLKAEVKTEKALNAIAETELSESLRFLDSIIAHSEIDKKYQKDLIERIKKNMRHRRSNRYLTSSGKIRALAVSLFPHLYISLVALYKRMRRG